LRIYLLRHGIAEDAGPKKPDAKRELTEEGRKKLTSVLRLAKRADVKPELVLTSPLVRAVQTAEMAREILGVDPEIQQTSMLAPDSSPGNAWAELRGHRKLDEVLLAGHEPLFSQLAAMLLGSPGLKIHMTKAGLVSIEMEQFGAEPRGVLRWMITPKLGE
jgi:phosphohistidine phosphatase